MNNSSVIGTFAESAVNFLFNHFRGGFDAFSAALGAVVKLLEDGLGAIPFMAMLVIFVMSGTATKSRPGTPSPCCRGSMSQL